MDDIFIKQAIATWQPIEFTKDDLENKQYRLLWWTSLEIEKEINRLWKYGYIPIGWIACTNTPHWLVYAQLMENLLYNPTQDETQMGSQDSWQDSLWGTDWEWELSGAWESEGDGWEGTIDGATEVWLG